MAAALVLSTTVLLATTCIAQQIAFPGAEGAGRFAKGGRGGDVYFVTNLNDSGAGSLRWGIDTATGPRTILFDVSGTIHLQSALKSKKSNITIAGQSAPGGGITIADQQFGISECNDVIVQYIRARLGDDQASRAINAAPDAFNVGTVSNVMIDHVTASWSVDEGLPVTHESTNVTVQYSIISEALKASTHPEGNHSYGTGIDHGDITFHHNLLANNDSRNPRVGDLARLDFVNNVVFNPGSRFGYSSGSADTPSINFVGNFGIDGPNTSSSSRLFNSESSANPRIFFQGNLRDHDKDGILEETVPTTTRLVGGTYTPLTERVDLPQVTTTDARGAYIQVLSHAGASAYRDDVDRRVVRGVMNQSGQIINTPSAVGGFPELPNGVKPADANRDGVADWFAALHGYGVRTTDPKINNVVLPSGYTMLESYLHALTPNTYMPTQTQTISVSTAFGRGADATISENGGITAVSGGNGHGPSLDLAYSGVTGATNQPIVMKFDLAQVVPGTITDASLQLTASAPIVGTHNFKLYAVEHDAPGWDWNEPSIEFNNAPGVTFDGFSGTLGLSSSSTNIPNILTLGILTIGSTEAGQTINFNNANLAVFLNQSAFFQNSEQRGVVTIIAQQIASASTASFYSHEGSLAFAPRISIQAIAAPLLTGDVNADGVVDSLDVDFVMSHWGQTGPLGDVNSDMIVDVLDLGVISANWTYPEPGNHGVPEPTGLVLMCCGAAVAICWRSQHRQSAASRFEVRR